MYIRTLDFLLCVMVALLHTTANTDKSKNVCDPWCKYCINVSHWERRSVCALNPDRDFIWPYKINTLDDCGWYGNQRRIISNNLCITSKSCGKYTLNHLPTRANQSLDRKCSPWSSIRFVLFCLLWMKISIEDSRDVLQEN